MAFVRDMASRIQSRFQLTTDGLYWYEKAARAASAPGFIKQRVMGDPDMDVASTSYVERNNLA